jgi:outer membrane protein TolC
MKYIIAIILGLIFLALTHINPALSETLNIESGDRATDNTTFVRRMNITTAMQEALAANLDLAVANHDVTAGLSRVKEAKSSLLPQLSLGSRVLVVDHDRARALSGTQPERQWTGSLELTQVIYSEKVWAGFEVEKNMQTSREQARDAVRLDIQQAAATAYMDVLRAISIERIQGENVRLTRENLDRARIRMKIGVGGAEEVYRWESQIAESQRHLLTAQTLCLDAVNALNTIINRPLQDIFEPEEADLNDPMGILPDLRVTRYMESAAMWDGLKAFFVQQGLGASPELKQLDALIDAQESHIIHQKREFWVPTVSFFGHVSESLSKTGEGSDDLQGMNDTDWSAGIQATLPLYSGGGKRADLKRSEEELFQLRHERDRLEHRIEERILNSFHRIRASYPGIRLANHAAEAARKNLQLVSDSYARGLKSIIDLIDAQNQALVANRQAANAVYDFIIDLMSVQRSVGDFFLFASQEDRDAWIERLNKYLD